jgi:hypothetical protein
MRICLTLGSLPTRNNSFTVWTNFESRFLVNVLPGLSDRILISIMALYCR